MIKKELEKIIRQSLQNLSFSVEHIPLECPAHAGNGDYATSVALAAAKASGKDPKELAEEVKKGIAKQKSALIEKAEVAGPGFINIYLSLRGIEQNLQETKVETKKGYQFKKGEKINIEFISANPTGDLHIGHGRGAFYGDVLANVLAYTGADVTREYYINDSRLSVQIKELGKTIQGKGDQYKTPHLEKMIKELKKEMDVSQYGSESPLEKSEQDAGFMLAEKVQKYNSNFIKHKLGIRFDSWYSEDEHLRAEGANERTLEALKDLTYEREGAVWLKTGEYGDDEDRVVVRSDRTATYFLTDIAYHIDKFARGYHSVIDVWGADHHGHVKRMHAVGKMLGWPEGEPHIFVTQLVSLKEGGEVKKMSKRAGTAVLLEDLVDEYGIDVVRWFFAEKSLGTHMEFDAALAKEQSQKNPVFYVQYAHARIASVLRNAETATADNTTLGDVLAKPSARSLAVKLLRFPEVIEDIDAEFQVHKLTTYAYELASEFSQFYRDVRVIDGGTYDSGALELIEITKKVLAKSLGLLGIQAPEKM